MKLLLLYILIALFSLSCTVIYIKTTWRCLGRLSKTDKIVRTAHAAAAWWVICVFLYLLTLYMDKAIYQ